MNLIPGKSTIGEIRPSAQKRAGTTLRGRWLLVARLVWVILALAIVAANVVLVPAAIASFLSPAITTELHTLHLSSALYLTLTLGIHGLCVAFYLAIAALLFWRRSEDRMAFFGSLMLLTFGGAVNGVQQDVTAPSLAGNLALVVPFLVGQTTFLAFFFLFPSGHLVPRWSRWLIGLSALYWGVLFFVPTLDSGLPGFLMIPFLLAAIGAQIYRYRRISTGRERRQTRWVVFGGVLSLLCLMLSRLLVFVLPPAVLQSQVAGNLLGGGSVYLALILIPIFLAMAMLHDQLFDIDLIINRTLVYATLTVGVIGLYVLVVGYLGALFRTEGNLLISLIATGLIAVLFQPLRTWLQRGANRLLYGLRDEPYRVLTGLGQRLKTTLDADAVLPTIVTTIKDALKLSYAAIEVTDGATTLPMASTGSLPAREPLRLPLAYQRTPVGTLLIAPRGHDETLTPADLRLLDDLAQQIGLAVHTVRLTRDLQRSRQYLVTTREEERRRLRRDLHDGLGPMLSAVLLKVGLARTLYQHDPATTGTLLSQLESEIELVITDIRRLVYNLRPPALDELGLAGALHEYAARLGGETPLTISVAIPPLPPLPAAVEVAAYRLVQEAVTNVLRHAHAHTCQVRLQADTHLHITVEDDGIGLEHTHPIGVGLLSMRERAEELGGSFSLTTARPAGTVMRARLPLGERQTGTDTHL